MPRTTIFSKMGFKPDPVFAKSELLQQKQPFYNRVTHHHEVAKQRYASLNFPINANDPMTMKDRSNPNLLDSVRK